MCSAPERAELKTGCWVSGVLGRGPGGESTVCAAGEEEEHGCELCAHWSCRALMGVGRVVVRWVCMRMRACVMLSLLLVGDGMRVATLIFEGVKRWFYRDSWRQGEGKRYVG
jgi:hypothetical protein